MRLGDLELGDAPEKEYRAQWIRDAARDLTIAAMRAGRAVALRDHKRTASDLWDLYVKERE